MGVVKHHSFVSLKYCVGKLFACLQLSIHLSPVSFLFLASTTAIPIKMKSQTLLLFLFAVACTLAIVSSVTPDTKPIFKLREEGEPCPEDYSVECGNKCCADHYSCDPSGTCLAP